MARVFQSVPFARWLGNSFLITAITIPGVIITGSLTAYSFARFNYVGKEFWFVLMLGTMMIPTQVTLIPQYVLFFNLKLINTYVPLTIGSWLGGGAFMIFLLRQFIMSIPARLGRGRLNGRRLAAANSLGRPIATDEAGAYNSRHTSVPR